MSLLFQNQNFSSNNTIPISLFGNNQGLSNSNSPNIFSNINQEIQIIYLAIIIKQIIVYSEIIIIPVLILIYYSEHQVPIYLISVIKINQILVLIIITLINYIKVLDSILVVKMFKRKIV